MLGELGVLDREMTRASETHLSDNDLTVRSGTDFVGSEQLVHWRDSVDGQYRERYVTD